MIIVRGLEEPLVPTGPTTAAEDDAVNQAVSEFYRLGAARVEREQIYAPFERYVATYPHSGWTATVLTDLGLAYYHMGYFTRTFEALNAAWQVGRDASEQPVKAIIDRAVAELARMHARVGHADEVEGLLKDIGDRPITGPATEIIAGARQGAWHMRTGPGEAFLCGPRALYNMMRTLGASQKALEVALQARSGPRGFRMDEVVQLADSAGVPLRAIYRAPGQAIPVPSVINWKVHHYGAIVSEDAGAYTLLDPTFGHPLVISKAAIDAEASGYFLVPRGTDEDPAWRDVAPEESKTVFGMGYTVDNQPGTQTDNDTTVGGGCGSSLGMCIPDVHAMSVSLNLKDTPVGYAPQKGPPVYVRIAYNQRDTVPSDQAVQPAFNVGQKWTTNLLSYVLDDPTTLGGPTVPPPAHVARTVPGGGFVYYDRGYWDPSTGAWKPEKQSEAVLSVSLSGPIVYTLTNPDGSKLVYDRPDGSTAYPRRIFITKSVDPQGNSLTYSYDSSLRLTSVTDAEGRVTTLRYGEFFSRPGCVAPVSSLLITSITDPFGRAATLCYNSDGRLHSILDVIGVESAVSYDASGLVNQLTTPYGTTVFRFGETASLNQGAWCRWIETTDPLNQTERVEFNQPALNSPVLPPLPAEPAPPTGMSTTNPPNDGRRNTFYWNKYLYKKWVTTPQTQCDFAGKDYAHAKIWHWVHNLWTVADTSPIPESTKDPLESRIYFSYDGQSSADREGTTGLPNAEGRVLDVGQQLKLTTYAMSPKIVTKTDPVGRVTKWTYALNNVDLLTVQQQISSAPTYATLLSYGTYNSQHLPASMTDAAGQLWTYTYNTAGQLFKLTDPLSHVTTYNRDSLGRLTTIINANNFTSLTNNYLAGCETTNPNHINCDLPVSVTDSEGRTLTYTRDRLDRVTAIAYPDGTTDTYEYTNTSRPLDIARHVDRLGRVTTYGYDANRRLTSITAPGKPAISYSYHENDALKSITDENGKVTTFTLDDAGRPSGKLYNDGNGDFYQYETRTSRLKQVTDSRQRQKRYSYYADDTIAGVSYYPSSSQDSDVSFVYDQNFPRRTLMTSNSIGTTSWFYWPVGSKGALKLGLERGRSGDLVYTYDELGRPATQTVPGDTSPETWTYDAIGRATRHTTALGTFTYTFLGQTASATSRALNGIATTAWSYDTNINDRRLIGITNSQSAPSFTIGYQTTTGQNPYQVTSVLQTGAGQPNQRLCYQYDAAGQLQSVTTPTVTTGTCTQSQTTLYSYAADPAGNLTTFTGAKGTTNPTYGSGGLNQIATNGTQTFSFQEGSYPTLYPSGNETWDSTRYFTWDTENRLSKIDFGGEIPPAAAFSYDGLGRRILMYPRGTSQDLLVWCGSKLCSRLRDDTHALIARYYDEGEFHPDGALIAPVDDGNGGAMFVPYGTKLVKMPDHQGNARAYMDATNGAIVASFSYTPYGEVLSGSNGIDMPWGGLYREPRFGLYYSNTRVYDPSIGRWLSRDTIGEKGGNNLYEYVGDDPVNRVDPNGTIWLQLGGCFLGAALGVEGALATAAGATEGRKAACKKYDDVTVPDRTLFVAAATGCFGGVLATLPGGSTLAGVLITGVRGIALGGATGFVGGYVF